MTRAYLYVASGADKGVYGMAAFFTSERALRGAAEHYRGLGIGAIVSTEFRGPTFRVD